MAMTSHHPVLGLMAGTSVDGIDASIILTDGTGVEPTGHHHHQAYRPETKQAIFAAMTAPDLDHTDLADRIADDHADAVTTLMGEAGMKPQLIGFHGQTIHHDPATGISMQIGNPERLAERIGIPVACDFRLADLAAGGQGAPLAPIYHQAVIERLGLPLPAAIVNIGGISNISIWNGETLHGYDTGPGNGLMDQLARDTLKTECDHDGKLALSGTADATWVRAVLDLPYFKQRGPKSLDRDDLFAWCDLIPPPENPADRMASFMMLTATSLVAGCDGMAHLVVTGGGARNPALMSVIRAMSPCVVTTMDDHGRNGDFLEAELMAYLAARVEQNLPLTFPETTGVKVPCRGGRIVFP